MENQAIQNPTPEPTLTPVQVSEPTTKFPIMHLVLSLFILVLLASTVFLCYQNRQLKNMLASYQAQPAVSPTPTVYQSPIPATTADPTANWKTYTDSKYNYSFKYPDTETIKITDYTGELSTISLINTKTKLEDLVFYVGTTDESTGYSKNDTNYTKSTTNIGGLDATRVSLPMGQNPPQELVFFTNNGKYYHFQFIWDGKDQTALTTFDQILSTFKFTN